jgi:hypothetical protein
LQARAVELRFWGKQGICHEVEAPDAGYGGVQALWAVSLRRTVLAALDCRAEAGSQ